ncbi:hypothetical protein OBBRIDRAFT_884411 [Obba rivulosa]|uniref:BRCT domain-containing protein n=1 Tax=Obba rivulosa TaxID=1052685 RepID=A0A8E2J5A1_9APHY|nr:hypothetical protein OBBRIDRAFT_884411 [Obba rivulosa]
MPGPFKRRNKSNKVPNVKLRPAAPGALTSRADSGSNSHDSWTEDPEIPVDTQASVLESCPRPFRGITICATGISDKTTLFKQAIELGAQYDSDLRDNITHLIAEAPGSAKYKCALENRIPIMHPSWVTESYQIWLRGDDVDVQETIRQHRLPIFPGVIMTLSGFDDIDRRTEINRLLTEEGGTYVKNLERPVKVTHLLCSSQNDVVTEKMRYAEKFNQRGEADISVVWEEWFWDCLEFGGRFDEADYEISKPPPERKSRSQGASSQDPAPLDVPGSNTPSLGRPAGPDDEEEIASVKRVPAVTLQLWQNLLKPRGFELVDGKLVRSPSKSQSAQRHDEQEDPDLPRRPVRSISPVPLPRKGEASTSTIAALRKPGGRRDSTPSQTRLSTPAPAEALPLPRRIQQLVPASSFLAHPPRRSDSMEGAEVQPVASTSRHSEPEAGHDVLMREGEPLEPASPSRTSRLFAGLRFQALGEAESPAVHAAVENSGGFMMARGGEDNAEVDFIIVRLVSGSHLYRKEEDESLREKYRTECWLESCITQERICSPDEHIAFRPLGIETPISDADAVTLTYSGLDESEACWIRRLARALGINLATKFSRRSTHLLCPSGTGAKAEKARDWDIPVVDMTWLANVASTGILPMLHETDTKAGGTTSAAIHQEAADPDIPRVNLKGKGKEHAPDMMMTDITKRADDWKPHGPDTNADNEDLHFGEPGALLGSMDRQFSDATPPPVSRATTVDLGLPNGTPSGSRTNSAVFDQMDKDGNARIPSSESPSPMKLLPDANVPASSPIDRTKHAAKILQESITTLLGKRPSTEDDAGGQQSRKGKRLRVPSKTKAFRRQHSGTETDRAPLPMPEAIPNDAFKAVYTVGDDDLGLRATTVDPCAEISMRITYEDPGQQNEQKRLMRLLDGQKREFWEEESAPTTDAIPAKGKKGGDARRRSARIAVS